jgi:hypothetical protein
MPSGVKRANENEPQFSQQGKVEKELIFGGRNWAVRKRVLGLPYKPSKGEAGFCSTVASVMKRYKGESDIIFLTAAVLMSDAQSWERGRSGQGVAVPYWQAKNDSH